MKHTLLNRILHSNHIPFIMLVGDYETSFDSEDIKCNLKDSTYSPPTILDEEVKIRIQRLLVSSEKMGFELFDDDLARLDKYIQNESGNLILTFSKTSYFDFAVLNKGLDQPLSKGIQTSLRLILQEKSNELEKSKLPNPLAAVVSLVLEPEMKVVIVRRSKKNFEDPEMLSTPIGGSLSLGSGDINDRGAPNPFKTIIREAKEEIGLDIDLSQIRFFGLGRNVLTLKPELIGEVTVNFTEKELRNSWSGKPVDWWEAKEKYFLSLPHEIIPYLKQKNWSPAGWACIASSISRRVPDALETLE